MGTRGPVLFPETVWTRIKQASQDRTTAVFDFVNAYREPVRRFVLKNGVTEADAEDIVQEVFARIVEHRLLEIADEKKGRFRSFLLGITKNVVDKWRRREGALKRGGGAAHVSLDQPVGDGDAPLSQLLSSPQYDETFDALWMATIFERALAQLKAECASKGLPYHAAYSKYLEDPDATYASIAATLNVNENQVKLYIQRGKKKIVEFVKSEIAAYCSTTEEFADEVTHLTKFLTGGA